MYDMQIRRVANSKILMLAIGLHEDDPELQENSVFAFSREDAVQLYNLLGAFLIHPPTDVCPDYECSMCAIRDCPWHEPLHYHHDGCPACAITEGA